MNRRERYIETLTFGRPDRIPFSPGGPRESTMRRWHSEGLPEDVSWFDVLCEKIGVKYQTTSEQIWPEVNLLMVPTFEEKTLEHKDGKLVVQDWKGNICEISDEFDVTYLRCAKDFCTRRWIKCPVETREDWEEMKKRYDPNDPSRYPDDFEERVKKMKGRDYFTSIGFAGPFWQMREWCGFEGLCMLCATDPDFVQEMAGFWKGFVSATIARALDAGVVDGLFMSEDMAYKEKAMISPEMSRRFLLPAWKQWVTEAKQAGVSVIDMDSDGKVDELIPLWIEAGITVCDPMEVAAGNDINEYRRIHGHRIAYQGGIDKRAIAKGGKVIEEELARNEPVVRDGGFVPSCDHGVPSDISWPNFIHYGRLLAEMTGWL